MANQVQGASKFKTRYSPRPSGYVAVDHDYVLPREFSIVHELDAGGEAELEVAIDDRGAARCVRLEVRAPENGGIVTETLRAIPVGRLLHLGTTDALMTRAQTPERGPVGSFGPATLEEQRQFYQRYANTRRPRQGSPLTDETLAQVATVYRAALGRGDPPTATVAETMNVARSTAARWIASARERGLLGPAMRGRAGEAVPSASARESPV
jgi:Family of unknown function (DUF6214)